MGQTHLELEKGHSSHSFSTEQIFLFTFLLFLTPCPPYSPTAWDNVNGLSVLHSVGLSVGERMAADRGKGTQCQH